MFGKGLLEVSELERNDRTSVRREELLFLLYASEEKILGTLRIISSTGMEVTIDDLQCPTFTLNPQSLCQSLLCMNSFKNMIFLAPSVSIKRVDSTNLMAPLLTFTCLYFHNHKQLP